MKPFLLLSLTILGSLFFEKGQTVADYNGLLISSILSNVPSEHMQKAGIKPVKQPLLPPNWDPKLAGDEVLKRLVIATASQVKGAHDAEMVLVGNYAYVVAEVNDIRQGERATWPFIYVAMSIVNLQTLAVEKIISVAKSDQAFDNDVLPHGACFVPRIIQKDDKSLRCYFASENPDIRQSQTWFIDFALATRTFENRIYRAKIKTADGVFDMQPQYFYADAVKQGFKKDAKEYGMYLFDSFKVFDGKTYIAINNYVGRQNGVAVLNKELDTFEVVAHVNEPQELQLCEPAINRLPDGTWMAIIRQNGGNYMFSTSSDGLKWTRGEYRDFVPNGENSKPTFDKFNGIYYLGWQEATHLNGKGRTVFNVDISRDGKSWERKYRFEAPQSFQYPTFHEHNGSIWLTVTQGSTERIMFGKLETTGEFASQTRGAR